MFYPIKVNGALLQLNVDLKTLWENIEDKRSNLEKKLGYSPQETALLIISEAPNGHLYRINKINLTGWVNTGKVRLDIPDINSAVERIMNEFGEDPGGFSIRNPF